MNRKHRLLLPLVLFALAAAQILFLGACRKSSEPTPAATPQSSTATPGSKERHHGMFIGGVSPLIVSMSPDTVQFHNGHIPVTRFSLTYEIDHPEKTKKAYISVYADGVGEVQQFDVDVQPRGQIEFFLDASNFDFGPTVRFRVHCPYGDSDWYTMGSAPVTSLQSNSTREIAGVNPPYIVRRPPGIAGGVPITIASAMITTTCTPEAQVDSSSVELQNIVASDKRITALLPFDALEGRPVTLRHLQVKLVVNGPGMPAADIYNLNFVE
jgi:hypothetical protein